MGARGLARAEVALAVRTPAQAKVSDFSQNGGKMIDDQSGTKSEGKEREPIVVEIELGSYSAPEVRLATVLSEHRCTCEGTAGAGSGGKCDCGSRAGAGA